MGMMRSCFTNLTSPLLPKPAYRGFHSTAMKRMGGSRHAMYNLDGMTHQGLKMSLGVLTVLGIGVGLPVYAVVFQSNKTKQNQVESSSKAPR